MALIETNEYFPNAGLVWSRASQALWAMAQVEGRIFDWRILTVGTRTVLQVDQIFSGNTNRISLFDQGKRAAEKYPLDYIFLLSGIKSGPVVLPKITGFARNVIDYGLPFMKAMREAYLAEISGWTPTLIQNVDFTTDDPATRIAGAVWSVVKDNHYQVDWLVVQAQDSTPVITGYVNSTPEGLGLPALGPSAVVGGAGAEIDLAPIVAALNDIALIDVDYTANNGGAVWSMRGKVRTP